MNSSEILFRSSYAGYLMVEPKKKSESISEATKTHLVDCFVSAMYGRREEITGKFLEKGNEREEDSITLLSRVKKIFFKKNEDNLKNTFISGTPDLFLGESIKKADETLDTKTSWSAHTFFRAQKKELDDMYYWQGQCYMALTGASKHTVAYCLVNGTESAIISEKRRLAWRMNLIDPQASEEYKSKCRQIEINHIFDLKAFMNECPHFEFDNDVNTWAYDIPMNERVFAIEFERNSEDIERLYKRINDCRKWMNKNLFKPSILLTTHEPDHDIVMVQKG